MKIAVPAYFPDRREYDALLNSENVSIVVLNPLNGPGKEKDLGYEKIIDKLRGKGIETIGYVHTSQATRGMNDVWADMLRYLTWYSLDGIFLDETPYQYQWQYFYPFSKALQELGKKLIVNPGMVPQEDYIHIAYAILGFENTLDVYRNSQLPNWINKYPSDKFWHILHHTPGQSLEEALTILKRRNVGHVYVTDMDYSKLPSYWQDEVDLTKVF